MTYMDERQIDLLIDLMCSKVFVLSGRRIKILINIRLDKSSVH